MLREQKNPPEERIGRPHIGVFKTGQHVKRTARIFQTGLDHCQLCCSLKVDIVEAVGIVIIFADAGVASPVDGWGVGHGDMRRSSVGLWLQGLG